MGCPSQAEGVLQVAPSTRSSQITHTSSAHLHNEYRAGNVAGLWPADSRDNLHVGLLVWGGRGTCARGRHRVALSVSGRYTWLHIATPRCESHLPSASVCKGVHSGSAAGERRHQPGCTCSVSPSNVGECKGGLRHLLLAGALVREHACRTARQGAYVG